MEYYGYSGQILYIDLTSGTIQIHPLDMELARKFLGGWGINYRMEYDLLKPGIDPLSPDNPVIVGAGPMVGTPIPGAGKVVATMKLPVAADKSKKKYIVATAVGGSLRFGIMLKNSGYDHVVITGRAKKPSYLKIMDDDVEICDAGDLWGKDVYEASDELASRHRGKTGKAGVWVIGRSGENLLTTAMALVDKVATMGRWGGGAVLGSKNLKAVVCLGTKGIKVKDPKRFMALVTQKRKEIMSHPKYRTGFPTERKLGAWLSQVADNKAGAEKSQSKAAYPSNLYDLTKYAEAACTGCLDPCKTCYIIKEGRFAGDTMQTEKLLLLNWERFPELRLSHYGEALKLIDLINRAGLCTMTAIRMLYYVTRLYERGLITTTDTGGLVLKRGDIDSYARLLEKWVSREDIGDAMAEGWSALSERTGINVATDFEDGFAIVRGGDVLHDTRWRTYNPAWAIAPIVRARPQHIHQFSYFARADDVYRDTNWPEYRKSFYDVKRDFEKMATTREEIDRAFTDKDFIAGRIEKHAEDCQGVFTSLGTCDSASHWTWDPMRDLTFLSEAYTSATGIKMTPRELKDTGERVWNMEVLLNLREGFTRDDYPVPDVWLQHMEKPLKLSTGGYHHATDWFGRSIGKDDLYRMLDDYYDERGYDIKKGIPKLEKLRELKLDEFIPVIEPYL